MEFGKLACGIWKNLLRKTVVPTNQCRVTSNTQITMIQENTAIRLVYVTLHALHKILTEKLQN